MILLIAAFVPFICLYFNLSKSSRKAALIHANGASQMVVERIKSFPEPDTKYANFTYNATMSAIEESDTTKEAMNQSKKQNYNFDEHYDAPIDYYQGESYHDESQLKMRNHSKHAKMKQAKPTDQENRVWSSTKDSTKKKGVDLWQCMDDAGVKYNRTTYSTDEKRVLMKKYYHVVSMLMTTVLDNVIWLCFFTARNLKKECSYI